MQSKTTSNDTNIKEQRESTLTAGTSLPSILENTQNIRTRQGKGLSQFTDVPKA